MAYQHEELLYNKLKCLNEKNRIIALTVIQTLFISELTENEVGEAVIELMSKINQ